MPPREPIVTTTTSPGARTTTARSDFAGAPPSSTVRRRGLQGARGNSNLPRVLPVPPKRTAVRGGTSKNMMSSLALLSLVGLSSLVSIIRPAAADDIAVITPQGAQAGQTVVLKWDYSTESEVSGTTGDINPFEIQLRSCGDGGLGCENLSCGTTYRTLCEACMDQDGSYDILMPADVAAGDYVFSVTYMGTSGWDSAASTTSTSSGAEEVIGCSGSFSVEVGNSSSAATAAQGVPVLEATAIDQQLSPGQAFTAQWVYDDGEGERSGSFDVNLYSCANGACDDGSCGKFDTALCEDGGCYDPGPGDYDVRVPAGTTPGLFKLQVARSASVSSGSDTEAQSTCTSTAFDVIPSSEADQRSSTGTSSTGSFEDATPAPSMAGTARAAAKPSIAPTSQQPVASSTAKPSVAPTMTPAAAPTSAPMETPTAAPATSSSSSTGPGTPGTPPTPVPPRVTCSEAAVLDYSYKLEDSGFPLITISHASEDRDEGGCATLTGVWEWLATGPADVPTDLLYPIDPSSRAAATTATGAWLLRTSVDVTNGVMFEVQGTTITGGDCDELLLSSSASYYIRLRGAGGHLYFRSTVVLSWNEGTGAVHDLGATSDGSMARSYVVCLSEILEDNHTCDGEAQKDRGECRMDILDTEMGYLGYDGTESYGITWKVRGLCTDHSNVETLWDSVRVYGDMMNSDIHHMWYGMYSYGHLGGVWTNNEMHDNHIYGFDPHDDSDYLTISGNTCYNNGNHGIIASKRCDHLLVTDNVSFNNTGSGLMLHKSCDDSIVRGNELYDNDAGFSLVETSRTVVTMNTMNTNKWGIRVLVGSNDNEIFENSFGNNTTNDIMQYIGADAESDVPEVAPFTGFNERNVYNKNVVEGLVAKYTVDIEDSLETVLSNNEFSGADTSFSFIRANETRLSGNTGPATNAEFYVESSCFTTASGATPVC